MNNAKLANGCCVHQFTTIGSGAFIAMGTACRHDILPYCVLLTERCTLDRVGLFKSGRTSEEADLLDDFYTRTCSGSAASYLRRLEVDAGAWFANPVRRFCALREA